MSTKKLGLFIVLLLLILSIRFLVHQEKTYQPGSTVTFAQTLSVQPRVSGKTQQFQMNNVWIVTTRFPQYSYGERIKVIGVVQSKVINKNHPILMLYFPKIERVQKEETPLTVLFSFRQHITNFFEKSLPDTSANLLVGMLLGGNQHISKDFLEALQKSGTLHVIAASGMNVSMVGSFLIGVFGLLLRRQVGLVLSVFGIICYAALAGFEPSIIRASLMGGLLIFAQVFGRQNLPLFSLVLSGFVMLFVDPKLILDIGFQLSFLATTGLITIKPLLDSLLQFDRLRFFREQTTTTVAAQIATLPILLANFGSFSLLSVFANVLVLWTIPAVMVIGGVSSLVSFLSFPLAGVMLLFALPYLLFFEAVVRFFGHLPGVFTTSQLPFVIGVGYYLMLVSVILLLQRKMKR